MQLQENSLYNHKKIIEIIFDISMVQFKKLTVQDRSRNYIIV